MPPNSRPNFFILLGINPDERWEQARFETLLKDKQRQWGRESTAIGQRAFKAKQYISLLSQIQRVMTDPGEREHEAQEARTVLADQKKERIEKFEKQLLWAQSKGYLEEDEFKGFVKDFADVLTEPEISRRVAVRIQPIISSLRKPDQLDASLAREIAQKLNYLHLKTLYELLGKPPTHSRPNLYNLAHQLYGEVIKRPPSPDITLKMELAGYAIKIFESDVMRAKYDATLHQEQINALLKDLEEIVSRTSSKEVHEKQVDDFLTRAGKVGWGKAEALAELKAYGQSRKWTVIAPAPPTTPQQRCGFCFQMNDASLKFCSACHHELYLKCPNCGEAVVADAIGCGHCGFRTGDRFWVDDSIAHMQQLLTKKQLTEAQQLLNELEAAWKPRMADKRLEQIKECRNDLDKLMTDKQHPIDKKIGHQQESTAVKIFFCYAREDEVLLKKLQAHLKPLQRQGLIDVWHDRDISAGTEWEKEISERLNAAQIILLLVSPDFMNSEYCYGKEMQRAIERHEKGEARVIPLILRHIYWQGVLGKFQALPTDGKPITDRYWHSLDEALFDAIESIRKVIGELKGLV